MVKVQLEDKDFAERGAYFDAGVHEVYIQSATRVVPESGAEYVEVEVLGDNDATDKIRMYTSEKAAPYTLANLARIGVHNKSTEAEKQKVRDAFKGITDTDMLDDKFLGRLKDMQAWILTAEDTNGQQKPNGGYYLRSSLYSYQPKAPATTSSDGSVTDKSGELTKDDLNDIPFN